MVVVNAAGEPVPELQKRGWLGIIADYMSEQGVDIEGCVFKMPLGYEARVIKQQLYRIEISDKPITLAQGGA